MVMMSKFVGSNRDQRFLLPPDLRDWIPEDDLAHFVLEAVERVGMERFKVNERGTGDAQYHPRMMLALLIYCYANGIFSSRRIERATHRDIGVRFIAANTHPDHDTICKFRRENAEAGKNPVGITVNQQGQHHAGMVLRIPRTAFIDLEAFHPHPLDRFQYKMGQVVLRNPE